MLTFADWFPLMATGSVFTLLGSVKLFGLYRGIEGGRDKPLLRYVCGM